MADVSQTEYSFDDFDSGRVFEYIASIKDPFDQAMAERRLSQQAIMLQFRNFKKLLTLYKQKQRESNAFTESTQ